MAVLFRIEYVLIAGDPTILAECLEKDKNFEVTKNMRLGSVELEEWFSMPRALDQNGQPRCDLFVFAMRKKQDASRLKKGDIVQLLPGNQIEYLLPWQESVSDPDAFQQELHRELAASHPLFGAEAVAVARRIDCDDVLFKLADGKYAVVHLTWSGKKESNSDYPATRIFDHWKDVYEKVILEDCQDYSV